MIVLELFFFSAPIIMGQLAHALISTGDIWVAGKHATLTLASIGVANAIISPVIHVGQGLLMGISPILAQKRGKGEETWDLLFSCLVFAAVLSLILVILSYIIYLFIPYFNLQNELLENVKDYVEICAWSLIGTSFYYALKEFLQAHEKVFFSNLVAVLAILFNISFNFIFVFGFGIFPRMDEKGLAVASLLTRILMGIILLIYTLKVAPFNFKIDKDFLKRSVKLGFPISLTILMEVGAFCAVTVISGQFQTLQSAAHNVVLNITSITFMIPYSIGSALSVKIGHALGTKNIERLIQFIKAGFILSLSFTTLSGMAFWLIPEKIAYAFSKDLEVIALCSKMLFVAALFQLFDGAQVTMAGILRGIGISKPNTVLLFIGYWIFGIPTGLYLAFHYKLESLGLWIGLATALFMAAIGLGLILNHYSKKILINAEQ